jgi:acetamidase/formamidase
MTLHTIEPGDNTLHGYFSRELPPALTIDPGDTVRFVTLDAGWGLESYPLPGSAEADRPRRTAPQLEKQPLYGHALCGPVEIRGAKKGDVLAVHIGEMRPGPYGFTGAGGTNQLYYERYGVETPPLQRLVWSIDADRGTATSHNGFTVSVSPFLGVLGMPPDKPGQHSTAPPRRCGGNLDCKELLTGTTLYLPVPVDGALFSAGDGHAAQGDGELSTMAIECPMEYADLTFELRRDLSYAGPVARAPGGWLTFGLHELLDVAVDEAINAMLDLMMTEYDITRHEAFGLASVVVDLRLTQLVNGTRGVHAFLPADALRRG